MTVPVPIAARLQTREPGHAVVAALERLLREDAYLLQADANERSISHRFGMYLQALLPKYHVDCEYNRDGVEPKRIGHIELYPDSEDSDGKTVFPDIIAHIRGDDKQNYLVIELKKSTSNVDRGIDRRKLSGYKRDLKYEFALFVELAVDGQASVVQVEWIDP
jgi:hypothetical protein